MTSCFTERVKVELAGETLYNIYRAPGYDDQLQESGFCILAGRLEINCRGFTNIFRTLERILIEHIETKNNIEFMQHESCYRSTLYVLLELILANEITKKPLNLISSPSL